MIVYSQVDEDTISKLPSNFFVNNLLAKMALTNDKPVAKILCDNCDREDTAESRCNKCGLYLCQFCTEFHKRSRFLKYHKLLTIEESNPSTQTIAQKIRCSKHEEEIIKLFCKTCRTTTCRDCTIAEHREHEYAFVEEVAAEKKQHLQQTLDEVKQRKGRVVQGIVDLKEFDKTLQLKKNSTITEINCHFDELTKSVIESLECRKNELVEEATSITNSKQMQIREQLEVLELALASCEGSIEFTELAFENGNDVQIVSMEKYILESLEQLKTVNDETEPCVTENMVVIIPSTLLEHLNEYDVKGVASCAENCTVSFEHDDKKLFPGKQYSIKLICFDIKNQRLNYGGQRIKPSFTGMNVDEVAVTDNKDGSHTISFRPGYGEKLKFGVSIDGRPAVNCSLTKQMNWVMSDGKGVITDDGLTMKGEGCECEYYWRVGNCYFESGVHTWKVQLDHYQELDPPPVIETLHFDDPEYFEDNKPHLFGGKTYIPGFEVGIVDCEEIDAGMPYKVQRECVYLCTLRDNDSNRVVTLNLDMDKGTLQITQSSSTLDEDSSCESDHVVSYFFSSRRVSPFFACWSPQTTLHLIER